MLKKISLAEQAYRQLAKGILGGRYQPETRLTEEGLCRDFGISRTPVRDAIARLVSEGLLEELPRRGCRVASRDSEAERELFECRARLEVMALENALPLLPEKRLAELAAAMQCAGGSREERAGIMLAADTALHQLIAEHCGNRYLRRMLEQLFRQTQPFRRLRNADANPDELGTERKKLLEALLSRDFTLASDRLREHILNGLRFKEGSGI